MSVRSSKAVSSFLLSTFVLAAAAAAQLSPSHDQLQVNGDTTGSQRSQVLATDELGNVFVVWSTPGPLGTDTSGWTIRGRRFDPTGQESWPEFQVNSYTTGDQTNATIAHLPTGGFVVVWQSLGSAGGDWASPSIQAQLLDAAGGYSGAQFPVNTFFTGNQVLPAVAADGFGNFMIVWSSQPVQGFTDINVAGRLYDAAGNPYGDEFQISTGTLIQSRPTVSADAIGNFVVAWQGNFFTPPDNSGSSIRARRFAGSTPGPEFPVNTTATGTQGNPTVAMSPTGEFLIAWDSEDHLGPDTAGTKIRARTFAADGTPNFPDFEVNAATAGDQQYPSALRDSKGEYVIVWQASQSPGADQDGSSVRGRRLKPDVSAFSAEVEINSFTTGDISWPAIAGLPDGGFVVAWAGYGSPGNDSSGWSVQARGFDSLFRDGFESGGDLDWSQSTP